MRTTRQSVQCLAAPCLAGSLGGLERAGLAGGGHQHLQRGEGRAVEEERAVRMGCISTLSSQNGLLNDFLGFFEKDDRENHAVLHHDA